MRLGCTYIQLDAPHYPLLIDPAWRAFYEFWLGYGIELDNAVIEAGRPATFGFHLCRGNQLSRWLVSGGYDAIAAPGVQQSSRRPAAAGIRRRALRHLRPAAAGAQRQGAWCWAWSRPRRRSVEPLEQITARLREASALVDAERLALSPQCGFATSVAGNAITFEAQRAKLALLVRAARDFLPTSTRPQSQPRTAARDAGPVRSRSPVTSLPVMGCPASRRTVGGNRRLRRSRAVLAVEPARPGADMKGGDGR